MQTLVKFYQRFHRTNTFKCFTWTSKFVFYISLSEMISFEKVFKQSHGRILQCDANNVGSKFLSTCYRNIWWISQFLNGWFVLSITPSIVWGKNDDVTSGTCKEHDSDKNFSSGWFQFVYHNLFIHALMAVCFRCAWKQSSCEIDIWENESLIYPWVKQCWM